MKKLNSLSLVLLMTCCGAAQKPSPLPPRDAVVHPVHKQDIVTVEPTPTSNSVYRIVDPIVTEMNIFDMRGITYRPANEILEHTPETRKLELALMNWLSERPFERKCISYDNKEAAIEAYSGETIGVIGPDEVMLPKVAVGNWVRITEEEIEKRAKQECRAMPYLKLIADGIRFTHEGKEYVSGGCFNEPTRNGMIEIVYPKGHRFFLAHRASDGRVHITRSTIGIFSRYSIEYRRKRRRKKFDELCDTRPESSGP